MAETSNVDIDGVIDRLLEGTFTYTPHRWKYTEGGIVQKCSGDGEGRRNNRGEREEDTR